MKFKRRIEKKNSEIKEMEKFFRKLEKNGVPKDLIQNIMKATLESLKNGREVELCVNDNYTNIRLIEYVAQLQLRSLRDDDFRGMNKAIENLKN